MHTFEQLRRGELQGARHLKLAADLTTFPEEIYSLADSLEVLDLSDNQLTDLPDDLDRFSQLKILFASNNNFRHIPESVGRCRHLSMIGFKHNQIETVSETCLPAQTRWLILTDNNIQTLPDNFGRLGQMEKLALAGNRLSSLPDSMVDMHQLGLLRIAANQLEAFPDCLLTLPKLAWLAFSGNPFCPQRNEHADFQQVDSDDLELQKLLGRGASGLIYKAAWQSSSLIEAFGQEDVAVKLFRGEVTTDGYPEDETDACLSVGSHPNLVTALARMQEPEQDGLVMKLIPDQYINLGQPPSLESCTRDVFTHGQSFTREQVQFMVEQMTSLLEHFEAAEVSHGDLYAHNVLIAPDGHVLFGDFGAASRYSNLTAEQKQGVRRIERRALAYFKDDLEGLIDRV